MRQGTSHRKRMVAAALLAALYSGALPAQPLLHDGMRSEAAALTSREAATVLRSGVIERVDPARGELVIDGKRLTWEARGLRIVHSGAAAPVSGLEAAQAVARLQPGQRVRYAVSAGPQLRLQLLYLEAQR